MEASGFSSSHFRFGRHEIDAANRTLTRSGRSVVLEPRVFDLLLYLIEHHHRVVSADELLEAVWDGATVTDASVSQAVHKARVAIGDCGQAHRTILTVRGRGFRFVAPLVVGRDEPSKPVEGALVGRAFELARLKWWLGRAQRGHGGLVYLAGEPGIGKTRLVQETVARTRARCAEVYVARCVEGEESSAFWPWRQLARKLAKGHTREALERLGAHRVKELLRAERELSEAPRPGCTSAPLEEPTLVRLFGSAAEGLARLAWDLPLVLVLENVHRADLPSLRFLRFLANELPELPILIIATFRDGELATQEAKARLLAEAERAATGETLTLASLSADETLRLAERRLGRRVSRSLLEAFGALSGGNPFLLGELLRLTNGREDACIGSERPGALRLPRVLRAAVAQQLDRLRPHERSMLGMAAVLGMEFDLVPLAGAVASAPEKVLRSLDAAAAVHVVVPVAGKTHAFRFVHALVREALYEDLGPRKRAHLHLRAALALEASSRSGPALLAHHFCEAAAVGGAERGVETALEAARLSASRLDFERASGELQQAMRCLDFVPGASPTRRCEILVEAARAATHTDARRGRLLLSESARIAQVLGDNAQRMLVAIAAAAAEMSADETRMASWRDCAQSSSPASATGSSGIDRVVAGQRVEAP
jgi:predicted ATPase/DNA-binding winged helix-turn-helix (wHTH) protein